MGTCTWHVSISQGGFRVRIPAIKVSILFSFAAYNSITVNELVLLSNLHRAVSMWATKRRPSNYVYVSVLSSHMIVLFFLSLISSGDFRFDAIACRASAEITYKYLLNVNYTLTRFYVFACRRLKRWLLLWRLNLRSLHVHTHTHLVFACAFRAHCNSFGCIDYLFWRRSTWNETSDEVTCSVLLNNLHLPIYAPPPIRLLSIIYIFILFICQMDECKYSAVYTTFACVFYTQFTC